MSDRFPVLQGRRSRLLTDQKLDELRRLLWRAFQRGSLTEEELASTLERLEFAVSLQKPTLESPSRQLSERKQKAGA